MGHMRLGRLPKTRNWREVVELLDTSPHDTEAVAAAVANAADHRFRQLAADQAVAYCWWMLVRVVWAARGSFVTELRRLGIDAAGDTSALTLIARITERVRQEQSRLPPSGHFAEIGSLALRRALSETVGQEGPSLFGSVTDDVQRAFRVYSTPGRFGEVARRFFGDFMSRSLRTFVDRELSNHVGAGKTISNVDESRQFMEALDTYTRQSARIVQEFAGGWYSKHNWESRGEIGLDEAQSFMAHALRKLRTELKRGAAAA
jgi:hypothetical protein